MPSARVLCAAVVCLGLAASDVRAQTGENVLVVANAASAPSIEIAEYYVKRRHIPPDQLLKIRTSTADQITRAEFEVTIQAPISAWIACHSAHARILYIVLTKAIPLRI